MPWDAQRDLTKDLVEGLHEVHEEDKVRERLDVTVRDEALQDKCRHVRATAPHRAVLAVRDAAIVCIEHEGRKHLLHALGEMILQHNATVFVRVISSAFVFKDLHKSPPGPADRPPFLASHAPVKRCELASEDLAASLEDFRNYAIPAHAAVAAEALQRLEDIALIE